MPAEVSKFRAPSFPLEEKTSYKMQTKNPYFLSKNTTAFQKGEVYKKKSCDGAPRSHTQLPGKGLPILAPQLPVQSNQYH